MSSAPRVAGVVLAMAAAAALLPAAALAGPPLQLVPKDGRPAAGAKPEAAPGAPSARPPVSGPGAGTAQQRPPPTRAR